MQVIADIDAPEPADEKINAFLAAQGGQRRRHRHHRLGAGRGGRHVACATSGDKRIKMVGIDHDQVVLRRHRGRLRATAPCCRTPTARAMSASFALDAVRQGCTFKDDAPVADDGADRPLHRQRHGLRRRRRSVDTYQDAMVPVTDELMDGFKERYMDCPS